MGYQSINNKQKILTIINHLISTKNNIKVFVKDESTPFVSRIINAEESHSSMGQMPRSIIIINKLSPEKGNNLVQSSEKLILKFVISDQQCICSVKYIGISSIPPHFGFILSLPETIEVEERRVEKRVVYDMPDFILAEICIGKGTREEKSYELDVIDSATYGLGMIIPEKKLDLLDKVKVGETIKNINFFAANAMLKIDGTIKHITKIEEGKFKGSYYIGIESKDIIAGSKSPK